MRILVPSFLVDRHLVEKHFLRDGVREKEREREREKQSRERERENDREQKTFFKEAFLTHAFTLKNFFLRHQHHGQIS
jgi:hypothetical protein